MTTPLNRDRFSKLISLAESPNDNEALAAVRKAASMARAAGLSLGEAVSTNTRASTSKHDSLGYMTGFEAGVKVGYEKGKKAGFDAGIQAARIVAGVEIAELKKRQTKSQHYARGVQEGRNAERADAEAKVAAAHAETNEAAFRRGYAKGQDDAQPAINSAYSRGFNDGKAGVDWTTPKRRVRA